MILKYICIIWAIIESFFLINSMKNLKKELIAIHFFNLLIAILIFFITRMK